ncbi:MAG: hypothetical protein JNM00_05855, partial [Flavobacteriales bacterium]|nr:hypothetical protein [Flavobacteriales bacterium]
VPADVTITCGDQIPPVPTDVYALDNCDDEVDLSFSQTQTGTTCPYDIIRTWEAVDHCFNGVEVVQIIHVEEEIPQAEQCAADFNGDGIVNLNDLLVLTAYYGCTSECGVADINSDGMVNISDFLIFNGYFGLICE